MQAGVGALTLRGGAPRMKRGDNDEHVGASEQAPVTHATEGDFIEKMVAAVRTEIFGMVFFALFIIGMFRWFTPALIGGSKDGLDGSGMRIMDILVSESKAICDKTVEIVSQMRLFDHFGMREWILRWLQC